MLTQVPNVYSVWQRKDVTTFTITPIDDTMFHNGRQPQHISLQEAVDSLPIYARLVIGCGTFQEQLSITKPIEIVGDDSGVEEPTIVSRGPTISIGADIACFIAFLKIKTKSISGSRSEPPSITMSSGKAVLFHCEMTSVVVAGTANPVIEHCLIAGNSGTGLTIRDGANGRYLKNEITNHGNYCVEITSRGQPLLQNNDIHTSSGDATVNPGNGLVRLSGGGQSGTGFHGAVRPSFIGNKFQDEFTDDQKQNSQMFFGGAGRQKMYYTPELSTQRVSILCEHATPVFEDNSLSGGVVGLSIIGGSGKYSTNIFSQAMLCGVYMRNGAQVEFLQNKITQNLGGGMYIDGCSPVIEGCTVTQCRAVGISIHHSSNTLIQHCLVDQNRCGISILGQAGGTISQNEIAKSETMGIRIMDPGCKTKIIENKIHMNGGAGIYAANGARPVVEGNTIFSQRAGILCAQRACVTATKNYIYGNELYGLCLQQGALGEFRDNKFCNGGVAAVRVADPGTCPLLEKNELLDATVGLLVTNRATGTMLRHRAVRRYRVPSVHRHQEHRSGHFSAQRGLRPLSRLRSQRRGRDRLPH